MKKRAKEDIKKQKPENKSGVATKTVFYKSLSQNLHIK